MNRPEPPQGWEISEFDYKGESITDYNRDDTIFCLERIVKDRCDVIWLEARVDPTSPPEDNYFNVYRSMGGVEEALDPSINSVEEGIKYCIMVAEYFERHKSQIPGAGQGFIDVMAEVIAAADKKQIPITIDISSSAKNNLN